MDLSKEKIKKIAGSLDAGFLCYIHRKTQETKFIFDFGEFSSDYIDEISEDLEEIENNIDEYINIEKMPSRESFQVMEDFLDVVSDKKFRERLLNALNRKSPFSNFKHQLKYNQRIREHWFTFKASKYEEWVINTLRNISEEEEEE